VNLGRQFDSALKRYRILARIADTKPISEGAERRADDQRGVADGHAFKILDSQARTRDDFRQQLRALKWLNPRACDYGDDFVIDFTESTLRNAIRIAPKGRKAKKR
jgi:hypothetical protein